MARIPPLENREQWATLKFKIAQKLTHPAYSKFKSIKGCRTRQSLQPNQNGYIDLDELSGASGAYFQFQSGITAVYGSAQTGVDLYNAAFDYHDLHPGDAKLSLNDAGIESGNNFDSHQTHNLGRSIDMSYIDANGNPLHVKDLGVWRADDSRMQDLVRIF